MGTTVRIVAYADRPEAAEAGARAAFDRIAALNGILSDWDSQSEVARMERRAHETPVSISEDLWAVLARARQLSERSDGAFDVTVGPFVRLWRRARRQVQLPTPARLSAAASRVGYRKVTLLEGRRVRLGTSGMRLDFGAIGKGYAAQEALSVLRSHGLPRSLVDAGGDLVLGDAPPATPGWRIGLGSGGASGVEQFVVASNCAVATSGDAERHLDIDGVRYSHIVDPRSGLGAVDAPVATAIAPDGATADALASIGCVAGERAAGVCEALSDSGLLLRWPSRTGGPARQHVFGRFPEVLSRADPAQPAHALDMSGRRQ